MTERQNNWALENKVDKRANLNLHLFETLRSLREQKMIRVGSPELKSRSVFQLGGKIKE